MRSVDREQAPAHHAFSFALLVQVSLATCCLLWPAAYKSQDFFLFLCENWHWNFDRYCLDSIDGFGKYRQFKKIYICF